MLFNSLEFLLFFPVVFVLYWFVFGKWLRAQNLLIVIASYVFYGWWDWRFLSLIAFSTLVDFLIGLALKNEQDKKKRKSLLWLSLLVNLGFLAVFKYFNFFIDSLYDVIPGLQAILGFNTLEIILPVGISFYTFQTLSYTIDVYKGKLEATDDFIAFAAFVSFFPQLVAGPIERATNLLPQFFNKRNFDYSSATNGVRQILWGFFKKVVIADNCGELANEIFSNSADYSGSTLFFGALFFSFQIYGDFSGYSDIAIGTARLFGFDLMKNFAFPYFSRDIAEFWRRWHISLSTWFRDYLYVPLGGSRGSTGMRIRNIFIIFLVSGFWHGANWTFIIWGGLNAVFFLPLLLMGKNRVHLDEIAAGKIFPSFVEFVKIVSTFILVTLAWIFFRATDVNHAFEYLGEIFSNTLFVKPEVQPNLEIWFTIFLFIIIEWLGRTQEYAIQKFYSQFSFWNYGLVLTLVLLIYLLGNFNSSYEFIYFQF